MFLLLPVLLLQHFINAADVNPFDPRIAIASNILQDRLNKFFAEKQHSSLYSPGSVTVKCSRPQVLGRDNVHRINCSVTVDDNEMSASGPLGSFATSSSPQDIQAAVGDANNGLAPKDDRENCLRDLFLDPDEFEKGIFFSPFQASRFKIYDPAFNSYSYYLLSNSVIEAFSRNPSIFYYILADKRSAAKPHLMPLSCQNFFNSKAAVPVNAPASTDNPQGLIELCGRATIVLQQHISSFKEMQKSNAQNRLSPAMLIQAIPANYHKILSASTNISPNVVDLVSIFERAAKIVQDMSHSVATNPANLIDASKVVPFMTGSPTVPKTNAILDNHLCRRMIYHDKIWLSLRNVETSLKLANLKYSTMAYDNFDISDSRNLAFIKFHIQGLSGGFYGLMIWEVRQDVPIVKTYSLLN